MSTNHSTFDQTSPRMNVGDLTVGQELVRVITRTSAWSGGSPIVRREVPVAVKAISKTRLVVETPGGTVFRLLVDNSNWGKGNVKDILEGEASLSYGYREDFVLYTPDDAGLIADRERVAKHNAKAVPERDAKSAVAAAAKELTKETALEAIKDLQAYVDALDA